MPSGRPWTGLESRRSILIAGALGLTGEIRICVGGDHMDVQRPSGCTNHRIDHGAMDKLREAAPVRRAEDKLRGILGKRHLDERGGHIGCNHLYVAPAKVIEKCSVL